MSRRQDRAEYPSAENNPKIQTFIFLIVPSLVTMTEGVLVVDFSASLDAREVIKSITGNPVQSKSRNGPRRCSSTYDRMSQS